MTQVTVRGPKEDVEKAKGMLESLSTEKQLTSVTAEVRAKPEHHKFLIGVKGANIKSVREETGARIIFPTEKDTDREAITILGTKEAVAQAKKELEVRIKALVSSPLSFLNLFCSSAPMSFTSTNVEDIAAGHKPTQKKW